MTICPRNTVESDNKKTCSIMSLKDETVVSLERRKQVRKVLEFLKYDGQLILEPQWYSRTNEEENKQSSD
jgi:hypothetical protein